MVKLKKILYPSDFSEHSLFALPYAVELAGRFEAELHCLHVVDEAYQYWMGAGENVVPMMVPEVELLGPAEEQMKKFVAEHLADQPEPVVGKVMSGRPFLEIIRYARDKEIDLIVIATHGRGALATMLLGGVVEKVVRKAPCPVLTVRHPEYKFEMP